MFGEPNLKDATHAEKQAFIAVHKIDFIDLVREVDVECPDNYSDRYIDASIIEGWDIAHSIGSLQSLKRVFFTRKRFTDVERIGKLASKAAGLLASKGVSIHYLPSPARFINDRKRAEWKSTFREAGLGS